MGITTINGSKYFKSCDVRIFPASFRGHYNGTYQFDPEARLTTEFNLTHVSGIGTLQNSYIVSWNEKILKCVIGGYYFEIYNIEPIDFKGEDANTVNKLYIKFAEMTLKEADAYDCKRTTKVLASDFYGVFEGGTDLDREFKNTTADAEGYYFTGLGIGSNLVGDASLDVVIIDKNKNIVANPAKLLPNISSGTGLTDNITTSICEGFNNIASNSCTHAGGNTSVASGENAFAYGHKAEASGKNAIAFGNTNKAVGESTFVAGGSNNTAGTTTKTCSFATGKNNIATGDAAAAFGLNTEATGDHSHTEGSHTTATKNNGHAEGAYTQATESNAHAEGQYTKASGEASHAEGVGDSNAYVEASGNGAHAEGYKTIAEGLYSHAEGYMTKASGTATHASGAYTETTANYQTVVGLYNNNTNNNADKNALFVVGNGHARTGTEVADTRTNALAVGANKTTIRTNTDILGNLVVTGGSITLQKNVDHCLSLANNKTTIKDTTIELTGATNINGATAIKGNTNITGTLSASKKLTASDGLTVTTGDVDITGTSINIKKNDTESISFTGTGIETKSANIKLTGPTTVAGSLAVNATGTNDNIELKVDDNHKLLINKNEATFTGDVILSSIATPSSTVSNQTATVVDDKGKLYKVSLAVSKPTASAEADNTTTISYINEIAADATGKITASAKKSTIADGVSQGTIKFNNKAINVGGLGETSDVKFNTLELSEGLAIKGATALIDFNTSWKAGLMSQGSTTLEFAYNNAVLAGLTTDGQLRAKTFCATSDKRLKENLVEYKPTKSILDLLIYKYDFINGPKNQIGCLAQDLQEICPEVVVADEKGYLSIQESKIIYLLLDEVKALKEQIKKLEER